MATFWQDYVQLPPPKGDVVHYTQGARFAASRERILQRPKAFYERLLQAVATESDPCLNYLYEWVWFYIIGKPEGMACQVSDAELAAMHQGVRKLMSHGGGVSGTSGASGASGASGGDSSDSSDGGSGSDGSRSPSRASTDAAVSPRAFGAVLGSTLALAG